MSNWEAGYFHHPTQLKLNGIDLAVAHIQTELLDDAHSKDPRRTLAVIVLTKEGGSWLIAVAQNTEINRPPELNR